MLHEHDDIVSVSGIARSRGAAQAVAVAFIGFLRTVAAVVALGVALAGVGAYLLLQSITVEREAARQVASGLAEEQQTLDRATQKLAVDRSEAARAAETALGARRGLRELLD